MGQQNCKMTKEQTEKMLMVVKTAMQAADYIGKLIYESGLNKIDGCRLKIDIWPEFSPISHEVEWGVMDGAAGHFRLNRGEGHEKYFVWYTDPQEYAELFGGTECKQAEAGTGKKEKELPPDGLWLTDNSYHSPLDCGV